MISVAALFQFHRKRVLAARLGLFSFSANTCRMDRKTFPKRASRTDEQVLSLRGILYHSAKDTSNPESQTGRLRPGHHNKTTKMNGGRK
jgi:hypothetical protein